jgi:hypothetical protein
VIVTTLEPPAQGPLPQQATPELWPFTSTARFDMVTDVTVSWDDPVWVAAELERLAGEARPQTGRGIVALAYRESLQARLRDLRGRVVTPDAVAD